VNERADKLARKGCKIASAILSETIAYHAEKRTSQVLRNWKKRIKIHPYSGAFGEVTYTDPSIKPCPVFWNLGNKPEVFGRLTQLRTMHGYNPSYFARFNIPHDRTCTCGNEIPPIPIYRFRDHALHLCETHEEHRAILTSVHRDHSPAILLGSIKGLLAMAKFLEISGAFTADGRPYEPPPMPVLPGLDISDGL